MTDPGDPDRPADDSSEPLQQAHEPSHDIQQHMAGRFSLRRNKRAWLGITLSLIALAVVSAALIAVAVGGGTHQATSAASGGLSAPATPVSIPAPPVSRAPNGTSSKTKSTAPSAAQAAESAGALTVPTRMKSRVAAWQSSSGGTRLAAVSSLFGIALQERGLRQYPEMKSTCIQLAHRVSDAQAGPPIPVAALQMLYGQALTELAKGAADCQTAITASPGGESLEVHVDAAVLNQSVSELAAGAKDIFRSTAEIEIASRQA